MAHFIQSVDNVSESIINFLKFNNIVFVAHIVRNNSKSS